MTAAAVRRSRGVGIWSAFARNQVAGITSCALAAVLLVSASLRVVAQDWPAHPIMMVVPFGAGGSIDIPARRLAAELTRKLGQQVVVENRAGANGNIGGAFVAKSS